MGRKRTKIAFIHPDLGIGGAERLILDMANALNDEYDIIFLVNHFDKNHCFDELRNNQYNVYVFGDWIPRSVFGKCQALLAYVRMIYLIIAYLCFHKKEYAVDLHVVDLIPIAIPFLKFVNEKVIYYCHHPDLLATTRNSTLKRIYRAPIDWIECKATKASKITLVNSEYTKSVFQKTFPEIEQQIQVLYPTISSSLVELLSAPISEPVLSELNNGLIFLSINRFHPAKKLEMAIEAVNLLRSLISEQEWNRFYFVMAGGYDPISSINVTYYAELQELSNKLELKGKVIFLKSPTDKVKVQLLRVCHCLIYTPVMEHFGIVPLEAMMAEKPVIACDSGGPKETIDHGNSGYLCQPDSSSLAKFMSKMINDNNFSEMGRKGKERLKNMFSNELFSNRMKRIIENVLHD